MTNEIHIRNPNAKAQISNFEIWILKFGFFALRARLTPLEIPDIKCSCRACSAAKEAKYHARAKFASGGNLATTIQTILKFLTGLT